MRRAAARAFPQGPRNWCWQRPGGFPRRRDQCVRLVVPPRKDRPERVIMASDISLAVSDGARRMTYAELAAVRGVSALSAERLVRRKHWPRQIGNDGVVRVLVPLTEARKVGGNRRPARSGHPPLTSAAPAPDVRGIIREVIREISDAAPPDATRYR